MQWHGDGEREAGAREREHEKAQARGGEESKWRRALLEVLLGQVLVQVPLLLLDRRAQVHAELPRALAARARRVQREHDDRRLQRLRDEQRSRVPFNILYTALLGHTCVSYTGV